ncbi:capsule biosynthesis GfcC family protein [Pseudomonas panipatensis]|uniref:Capsule biosynthesis GfcC n=1 Tax=Pseudomonas panipatensis TaxID=428992 RepID=A0A1G8DMR9_9PSED|nr:capsule biosynthesis GfcC family protein [Pseudomonas panipatensis]SDH58957.1 Capsule biosynthesis GfcC [Pseudomonas panipatensis]SMP40790.1 Capsule biosynthesis GfcC [Pseudomonas panipatensis]
MSIRRVLSIACCALLLGAQARAETLVEASVEVRGDAVAPGALAVSPETRLADVFRASQVNAEGFWLGAAWLQPSLEPAQKRLKAGILFDLGLLKNKALLDRQPGRAALAKRLYTTFAALPVTGRRVQVLDPVTVEVQPAQNPLVAPGDRFLFPRRPTTLRVVGAVASECQLAFAPLRQARDYLEECPALPEADPDYLYLIQPDGQVIRLGIALWNRQDGPPVAPGATLLRPLKATGAARTFPRLGAEMAAFLATQPLPETAP